MIHPGPLLALLLLLPLPAVLGKSVNSTMSFSTPANQTCAAPLVPNVEFLAKALAYIRSEMPKSDCTAESTECQQTIMCCLIEPGTDSKCQMTDMFIYLVCGLILLLQLAFILCCCCMCCQPKKEYTVKGDGKLKLKQMK